MPQRGQLIGISSAAEGVQGEVRVGGTTQEGEEVPEFDADWGLETLVHVGEHWIDSLLQVTIPHSVTPLHNLPSGFPLLSVILRLLPDPVHGHMTHTRHVWGQSARLAIVWVLTERIVVSGLVDGYRWGQMGVTPPW